MKEEDLVMDMAEEKGIFTADIVANIENTENMGNIDNTDTGRIEEKAEDMESTEDIKRETFNQDIAGAMETGDMDREKTDTENIMAEMIIQEAGAAERVTGAASTGATGKKGILEETDSEASEDIKFLLPQTDFSNNIYKSTFF